ncbi:MAG TPA: MFS transporter [Streptosporangiaceae bacterium]|jgi:MFS family permease|nr:MFS transporter [Streptosporangiaceae bacterium]
MSPEPDEPAEAAEHDEPPEAAEPAEADEATGPTRPAEPAEPEGPDRARRGIAGILVNPGPLRDHRDFRRLWGGQLASQLGSQLTLVAVSYQTYRLTGSTAIVGLVSLGQLLPLLAGSLIGGPMVDAWDRRRVLLVTQLLLAVGCAGLMANALLSRPLLWPIFACTAENAAFQGVDWSARRASLRRLVPLADLPAALSLQSAAFQVTSVIGPAAAGLLIAHAGFALVYGLNVASFGVAFVLVALLPRLAPEGGGQPASLSSLVGGVRYMTGSKPLTAAFVIDLGAMVFGLPRALFPALAATVYGGGAATVGYLNAAPGVGALVGSLLTGHVGAVRRVGRAVVIGVVVWGLAITGFGLVPWLWAALALLAVAGAADVVSAVFRMVIVQQVTPDAMQGRVNSLVFAGVQGGPRVGDAEAGAVAAAAGPQVAAWSGGLLSVVTAAVTCWVLPAIWRYHSREVPDPEPGQVAARS